MLHKVDILGLTIDQDSKTPILILKTVDTEETIPIWIGLLEATSIASALQNINFDRPMTHDLFKNFIREIDADIERIEVCDLKDNTFFARIHFVAGERTFSMDARPSDAIAMAVRFNAPVFVDKTVIQGLASDKTYEMEDDSEEGKKWADYLSKLSPDDFGKYEV
ncbi:MAG: bifunctional nuclease family protein [Thermodesulfobacteriota bacterium]|nr:bifunctional nuclease family protein [Thermodesulfobacteriota bacterium]